MSPKVIALSKSKTHSFSKQNCESLELLEGLGVKGDAHMGAKAKHRYIAQRTPNAPNLRQVHLIHSELFEELSEHGFEVKAGQMGENITTKGLAVLDLPRGTQLRIGDAVLEVTGLRDPCKQLDQIKKGLMKAVLEKGADGKIIRKAGIMSIVLKGGVIQKGDRIELVLPDKPHEQLETV